MNPRHRASSDPSSPSSSAPHRLPSSTPLPAFSQTESESVPLGLGLNPETEMNDTSLSSSGGPSLTRSFLSALSAVLPSSSTPDRAGTADRADRVGKVDIRPPLRLNTVRVGHTSLQTTGTDTATDMDTATATATATATVMDTGMYHADASRPPRPARRV
jgi:hypothetical protein